MYSLEALGYSNAGIFSTVFHIGGIFGTLLNGVVLGVTLTMVLGPLVTLLFIITSAWGLVSSMSLLLVVASE